MIKAKSKIIVGKKTFLPGETVKGLSRIDKEWMKKAGYIIEEAGHKDGNDGESQKERKKRR